MLILAPLTSDEERRHAIAVEKVRRKLFSAHSAEEFSVVPGSERILSASAQELWMAGRGEYRTLALGGLSFRIAMPNGEEWTMLSVTLAATTSSLNGLTTRAARSM